jgi:hypothetical protein
MGILDGIFGSDEKVRTATDVDFRTVEMSYLDTLKLWNGNISTTGLETGPGTNVSDSGGKDFDPIVSCLTGGFFGGSKDVNTTVESSGWKVNSQAKVTKWDKARYAIGIKEIGIWSYRFVGRSGFVSKPFRTPKPIRTVGLLADEIIPKAFNTTQVKPWIRYWVSFGEGLEWVPIAPASEGPAQLVDGERIPQIIHVNSGIPAAERDPRAGYVDFDGEVSQARLKCILYRPDGLEDMSPVLKGYRLKMTVRGGL